MLTSKRSLAAASLFAGLAFSANPAFAQANETPVAETIIVEDAADDHVTFSIDRATADVDADQVSYADGESAFELTANVALVSEYRFRGVDLSGGDYAIQGGIDLAHSSGLYAGAWGSSLDEDTVGFGSAELDLYGGFGGNLTDAVSFDIGAIAYLYPNAGPGEFDYYELYGSLGFNLGPAEATLGVAYAPDQASLGDTDNFYVYTDLGAGIPGTPFTVTGHLGYTDGFLTFTDDGKAFDWSVGVEASVAGPVSVGVSYTEAEGDFLPGDYDFTDGAAVFSVSASF